MKKDSHLLVSREAANLPAPNQYDVEKADAALLTKGVPASTQFKSKTTRHNNTMGKETLPGPGIFYLYS